MKVKFNYKGVDYIITYAGVTGYGDDAMVEEIEMETLDGNDVTDERVLEAGMDYMQADDDFMYEASLDNAIMRAEYAFEGDR